MHLTLDQLLAWDEQKSDPAESGHVAGCDLCRDELARLAAVRAQLRHLAVEPPAHDAWPTIAEAASTQRRLRRWVSAGWAAAVMAAMMTLVVGVRGGMEAWQEAALARQTRELVTRSQRLEHALRSLQEGRVVGGRRVGTIVELEDRIASIDARLARAGSVREPSREAVELWRERVDLLDSLVSVQSTRATYVGL
jgi:hypothetical protein